VIHTLHDHLAHARERLVAAGLPRHEAALDAEVLARHVLGWDRARLVASVREPASVAFANDYDRVITRRAAREPVAQITGVREFWGLEFEVTRDVLTPRPETEFLVEEALEEFPDPQAYISIVDVGTGSGCLAIALATEFSHPEIIATDISEAALEVAQRNARRHGVNNRIAFVHTDMLPTMQAVDLIVSNPPYIPRSDATSLPPEVRDFEPEVALFAGEDGLEFYQRLFEEAAQNQLRPDGRLIVELGYDQRDRVVELASAHGWRALKTRDDLQGIPRVLVLAAPKPR
jgi:release factor glutamine methyltransferase